jgi:glycosyltransferase involved in cell wall biosynthesis
MAADCRTVVVLNDFTYVQGGASRVAIDEAVSLAGLGLDVIFIGAVGPVGPELAQAPLRVICLGQPQLLDVARAPGVAFQSIWNRQSRRAVDAILDALDPLKTVVHLHGYTKALSAAPVASARAKGFQVLCTLHDFFSACPNGAFFDYVTAAPCSRVALSRDCAFARCDKRRQLHKAFRVARSLVQKQWAHFPANVLDYIVLSKRSAAILRPYLPAAARFHTVPHGFDADKLPPVKVGAQTDLACIGRLDEEKGVRLLAETAAKLRMPICFVGDGPLRAELEAFPSVTVTGWLPPNGVAACLDRARCLVFPSLWYETYGLVVDEAAARGVPAVVSDVSAPSERLIEGVDGWVFRSGDANSLAAALVRTRDDAAVTRVGQAAFQGYWQRHTSRADHAAALVLLYQNMLRPRSEPDAGECVGSGRAERSALDLNGKDGAL